jgi:serine/threonine protein kinase
MTIGIGTRFDRYEILSLLGRGGMGEVYLAHDTRLGRKIALKLLPARYTQDEDSLRRFKQEAQVASALNHPNIITIHEVGQVDSDHFIATEFIEGVTLRKRMEARRMELGEALDVAIQVAGALAAAHAAGIIHRDIKPENIMVRPDGYVKVLDFGLAKLAQRPSSGGRDERAARTTELEAHTAGLSGAPEISRSDPYATTPLVTFIEGASSSDTAPGLVMGTLRYMSPEQVRGHRVDARTDIFSLGVVLYEMVRGAVPFDNETTGELVAAILEKEPEPLSAFVPDVPEVLEWITTKALMKDREERYQTAKELLTDLRRLKQQLELEHKAARSRHYTTSGSTALASRTGRAAFEEQSDTPAAASAASSSRATRTTSSAQYLFSHIVAHKKSSAVIIPTVMVALALAAFGLYKLFTHNRPRAKTPFESMRMARLTTTGKATRAAISPDGKYVVHVSSDAGKQSLWVRQVTTPNNVEVVAPADVFYRGLTFSRDGNYIYYVVQERNNPIQALYQVPVLGGTPRKLLNDIDSPITLSPDGERLAFIRRYRDQGEDALIVANADGSGEQRLAARKGEDFFAVNGPDWSPDGTMIACGAGSNAGGRHMSVVGIQVEGGAPLKVMDVPSTAATAIPIRWTPDGRAVAFIDTREGVSNIWSMPLAGGPAHPLTDFKSDGIFWFDWSPDGKLLACSRGQVTNDVVLISDFR